MGDNTKETRANRDSAHPEGSHDTRYRTLFHAIDEGFCIIQILFDPEGTPCDYRFLEVNAVFERQTGLENAVGKTVRELVPELDDSWFEAYGRVALTGESIRFENYAPAMKRWFTVFAYRFGEPEAYQVALLFKDISQEKEMEAALRASEARFRNMADTAPAMLWVTDTNNACTFLSQGWYSYTGQCEAEALGFGWTQALHPNDRAEAAKAFVEAAKDRAAFSLTYRLRRHDGVYRWVIDAARARFGDGGEWLGYIGSVIEVHERKLATEQLLEREQHVQRMSDFRRSVMELMEESLKESHTHTLYQQILERAVAVIPGAQAGAILLRNAAGYFCFEAAHGYDLRELQKVSLPATEAAFGAAIENPHPQVVHKPRTSSVLPETHQDILRTTGRNQEIQAVLVVPIAIEQNITAYLTLDNFVSQEAFSAEAVEMARVFAGQVASLIQRFRLEEELHRLAYQDSLTGLANRTMFKARLHDTLAQAARTGTNLAVLFIDLDNLKPINDSLGHRAGDDVLQAVAKRLRQCAGEEPLLARLGGDEYTLMLTSRNPVPEARQLAQQILASLTATIPTGQHEVRVSASIGISLYPHDAHSTEDLLRHADIAMYHAKQRGKNDYSFFSQEMEAAPLERVLLEQA